jgi:hypothetical protein
MEKAFYSSINISMAYYTGYFKPNNPDKYVGDPNNIIYRSRWELLFMSFCDKRDDVLKWASEELYIPYRSPIDGRAHRYYPDFLIIKRDRSGKIVNALIEIKPKNQTKPPVKQKRITRNYLYEVKRWGINDAKWKAANEYCKDRGWEFHILTEDDLNLKF